ncbi:MAG: hypothetical protein Q4G25_05880 [Paracoccus sp. (in: a-proteobacteria)]|nr:hypothetical protein [Paracoccus sp. (in: a-proteobacteria)]
MTAHSLRNEYFAVSAAARDDLLDMLGMAETEAEADAAGVADHTPRAFITERSYVVAHPWGEIEYAAFAPELYDLPGAAGLCLNDGHISGLTIGQRTALHLQPGGTIGFDLAGPGVEARVEGWLRTGTTPRDALIRLFAEASGWDVTRPVPRDAHALIDVAAPVAKPMPRSPDRRGPRDGFEDSAIQRVKPWWKFW